MRSEVSRHLISPRAGGGGEETSDVRKERGRGGEEKRRGPVRKPGEMEEWSCSVVLFSWSSACVCVCVCEWVDVCVA